MANISQLLKASHVVTSAEQAAFKIYVPILWTSPMNDTNYVVHATVELPTGSGGALVTITNITPTGCTVRAQASYTAGTTVVIHAMASHK